MSVGVAVRRCLSLKKNGAANGTLCLVPRCAEGIYCVVNFSSDRIAMRHNAPDSLASLLAARYGTTTACLIPANDTLNGLLSHRSVRAFSATPLAEGTLELLVAAAQSASTSSNLQTWSVVAVEDPQRKERLSVLANNQDFVRSCPLFLVWIADLSRLQTLGLKREKPHESLEFLEMLLMATIDATLAAQNAAVAAESLGLGVVYVGAIRNHADQVARELGLPAKSFATFGMCVGHPDTARPAAIKPRLPQTAVLHRETYDDGVIHDTIEGYNATMDDFYRQQNMKPLGPWDLHSLNRVRGVDALQGRERLVEILKAFGFGLR